jgi:hypothetical protein
MDAFDFIETDVVPATIAQLGGPVDARLVIMAAFSKVPPFFTSAKLC